MYPNTGSGSGGVGSASYRLGIEQNMFEADSLSEAETLRDTYASANSDWFTAYQENNYYILLIYSDSDGSKYAVAEFYYTDSDGTAEWTELQSFVGVAGEDAPEVIIQYSDTDSDPTWYDEWASGYIYLHVSTDGGETYTDPLKFIGEDAPEVLYQYSTTDDSDADWHDEFVENADYYMRLSTDDGETWSDAYRFIGESVILQYSTTGDSNWHTTMTNSDQYWRWSVDGGETWSDDNVKFRNDTSGLPEPYYTYINSDGDLVISNEDEELDLFKLNDDGLWVYNSVTTGTGSFHLADIMSIGAGGTEIAFVNELTSIARYPSSGNINMSTYAHEATTDRVHGDAETILPDGNIDTTTILDCNYSVTSTQDAAYVSVAYAIAEDYSGTITQYSYDADTDTELTKFSRTVNASAGDVIRMYFSYPFWVLADYNFYVTAEKEDGTYLQVYAGTTDSTIPYRQIILLPYTEYESYNANNIDNFVDNYNENFIDSDGDGIGFDFETLTNVPLASEDEYGIISIDERTISLDSDGVAYVNPEYIDITDLGNASSYLSAALQGTFDEDAVESDFTYAGFSADSDGTLTSVGMFWKYAPSDGELTVTLGSNTYSAGDILLCVTTIDEETTLDSADFDDYFAYVPDADNLATDTVAGSIMLTNDLGGTATAPTVEHVEGDVVEWTDETTYESVYLAVVDSKLYLVIDDGVDSDGTSDSGGA